MICFEIVTLITEPAITFIGQLGCIDCAVIYNVNYLSKSFAVLDYSAEGSETHTFKVLFKFSFLRRVFSPDVLYTGSGGGDPKHTTGVNF